MRRFILTILALLPLGLLLSAALAVLSGMQVDPTSLRVVSSGYSYMDQPVPHGWYVQVQRGLGKRHAIVHHASGYFETSYTERHTAEQVVPAWVNAQYPDSTLLQGERLRRIHVACGWPAPMLCGEVELDRWGAITPTDDFIPTGAAAAAGAMPIYGYQLRGVPLRPIWHGVLVNSIVFALLAWAVIAAAFWARRAWRARHNICVRCTYDLRGGPHAVCPECGTAVA